MDWRLIAIFWIAIVSLMLATAQIQVGDGEQGGVILQSVALEFLGNMTHGEMFIFNESLQLTPITSQNVFVNITDWQQGSLLRVNFDDNKDFIIIETGIYFVDFSVSFGSETANPGEYGFNIMINGMEQNNTHSQRDTSQTSIGNTGASGILNLERGDRVHMGVRDESTPTSGVQIHNAQFQIIKLGIISQQGGTGINESDADARYWCLDQTLCGNTPLSDWDMGGFSFDMVGDIQFTQNNFITDDVGELQYKSSQHVFGEDVGTVTMAFDGSSNNGFFQWDDAGDRFDYFDDVFLQKTLTVDDDTILDGLLNSSDGEINLENTNFTWANTLWGCLIWRQTGSSTEARICRPNNLQLDIFSNTIKLVGATLSLGSNNGQINNLPEVCLDFDTNNAASTSVDDSLCFDGEDKSWSVDNPIIFNSAGRKGLIFNSDFPVLRKNNFTFNGQGCFSGNCDTKLSSLGDFTFQNQRSVNTTSDFCLMDGTCLSTVASAPTLVSKTRIEDNLTDTVTYTDDDTLIFPVIANSNYTFDFTIFSTTPANQDHFFNFTRPLGDIRYSYVRSDDTNFDYNDCNNCVESTLIDGGGLIHVTGSFFPTASGNFILAYRSNNAGLGSLNIEKGTNGVVREVTI